MRLLQVMMVALLAVFADDAAATEPLLVASPLAEPAFRLDASCPGGYGGYLGTQEVCADVTLAGLAAAIAERGANEVVLLTSTPDGKTLYRVGPERAPLISLAGVDRGGESLTIRGQVGADGAPLVWLKGLDLVDTLCDPALVTDEAACRTGAVPAEPPSEASWDGRYELGSLAVIEDARAARDGGAAADFVGVAGAPRAYCVVLREAAGIVLGDLGFEDCWLVAALAVDSHDITLRNSTIHGSTFGLLAIATAGRTALSHSFVVEGNRWLQTPAAYLEAVPCAAPNFDLGCAVDLWDEIPWGVVHHHLWRPLNGALFASFNIAGNVLFADNTLERAFNGIRLWSAVEGSGRNVEIRGNTFRYIRDNPVEAEGRAENWIVKQNVFQDAHAWISTDGVAGGTLFIFGNRGWHDPGVLPGQRCRDDVDWSLSPQFRGLAGQQGHYAAVDESEDPAAVECQGHLRGVVLKTGDDARSGFPYLRSIAIFNNSWATRWPLFSSKHASPLVSFNNLIKFEGCGLDGPMDCRQIPFPAEFCGPDDPSTRGGASMRQFWTDDHSTLVADCFSLTPGPSEIDPKAGETHEAAHVFCRDVVNRSFGGFPYGPGICSPFVLNGPLFDTVVADAHLLATVASCRPRLADGTVVPDCDPRVRREQVVGALQLDGQLFDMAIPGAGYLGKDFAP